MPVAGTAARRWPRRPATRCSCCSRRRARCCPRDGPVTIRAMGGRRPLTFLVDGAPLPADRVRREAAWQPAGPRLLPAHRAGRRRRRRAGRGAGRAPRHDGAPSCFCWPCSAWPPAPADPGARRGRRHLPAHPARRDAAGGAWQHAVRAGEDRRRAGDPAGRYRRRTYTADRGRGRSAAAAARPAARHAHLSASAARPRAGTPGCRTASCSAATHFPVDSVTVGRFRHQRGGRGLGGWSAGRRHPAGVRHRSRPAGASDDLLPRPARMP